MDKGAIKTFAIEARKILMKSAETQAGFYGVTKDGCADPIQKGAGFEVYRTIAGTENRIYGNDINRRRKLKEAVENQGFDQVIEETAYTWFNRLIAIRFMEVNGYLPTRTRVLSSETGSNTPDLVAQYMDVDLGMADEEIEKVARAIKDNRYDDAFALLFIKQCNALNELLPKLFEKTDDYMELLLKLSYTSDGVVRLLLTSIPETIFSVESDGKIEIIGWLYQYYISEKHNQVLNAIGKKAIGKEDLPAATQIFTPDWVVNYMVDNSLGKYIAEHRMDFDIDEVKYLTDKNTVFIENRELTDIKFFDPCMGSGHILLYAFDLLIRAYRQAGYRDREAVEQILTHNLYGLDIDRRAFQLAYFSLMMKARSYDRVFFRHPVDPHVFEIVESNSLSNRHIKILTSGTTDEVRESLVDLVKESRDAKDIGSLISPKFNLANVNQFLNEYDLSGQISIETYGLDRTIAHLKSIVNYMELLFTKYEVVVTNPPYHNKYDDVLKQFIFERYKDYSGDLFSVFMIRNFGFLSKDGYAGFMTPNVWMFIRTYEKLREFIIDNKGICSLIQFSKGAFFKEATVDICSFVLTNANMDIGNYYRLENFKGDMEVQRLYFEKALYDRTSYHYIANKEEFKKIESWPISYWLSTDTRSIFCECMQLKEATNIKNGIQTGCNDKFLRYWYEVSQSDIGFELTCAEDIITSGKKWFPYNKGGEFRRWYGNNYFVVYMKDAGKEIKEYSSNYRLRDPNLYFKKSITWSDITSGGFSGRFSEGGFLFDVQGSSAFPNEEILLYILGFLNSNISQELLQVLNPTLHTQIGDLGRLPILIDKEKKSVIDDIVRSCILLAKDNWNDKEISWSYTGCPLLKANIYSASLAQTVRNYMKLQQERKEKLDLLESQIDKEFLQVYKLAVENISAIDNTNLFIDQEEMIVKQLLSYLVGVLMGRFNCEMCNDMKRKKIVVIRDEANVSQITNDLVDMLERIFGKDQLDENLEYIAKVFNLKNKSGREAINNYFLTKFYTDHLKMYQKKPIYWLFDSGKQNGFKCLMYMHKYNKDTVGRVRSDYLREVQDALESALKNVDYTIANSTSAVDKAAATKKREKYIKQLNETRTYFQALSHVALQRIEIDLDDGVKTNYAKFQGIEIVDENGKKQKIDLLAKI